MLAAGMSLAGLAGCSEAGGPSSSKPTVAFSVASRTGTSNAVQAGSETITAGSHTLVVDSVQVVLESIELKRANTGRSCQGNLDTSDGSGDGGNQSHDDGDGQGGHHDDANCSSLEVGPVLLDVPLGAGPQRQFSVAADTGRFREIEFRIHAPDATKDATLLQKHPEFKDQAIRVYGKFDGTAFSYSTALRARQDLDLVPPLVVAAAGPTNVTLVVDFRSWFLASDGATLIDPVTAKAGQPNVEQVERNIRRSFRASEDNHRGHDG